jgi:hypothetical protein
MTRIIVCEACLGDRGHDVPYDIDRVNGALIERWVPCRACDETGEVEVDDEPIGMEDLDA